VNIFNRVLVIVLLLGFLALLVASAVLPASFVAWLEAIGAGAQALLVPPVEYIRLGVTAVLLVLVVLLLVLELRRGRRPTVTVRQAGGGTVELGTESVARSLEYHIGQVPGVAKVQPAVVSKGKVVTVALDLELDPMADLRAKSEEVVQLARELVEGKLGLKLASRGLRVKVRQAPYSGGAAGPQPQPPARAPPPPPGARAGGGRAAPPPTPPPPPKKKKKTTPPPRLFSPSSSPSI